MCVREYWRKIHNRAVKDTRVRLRLESTEMMIVAALTAIATIAVLAFWGSEGAAGDEIWARGITIGVILAIFPIVYCTRLFRVPAEIHSQDQETIALLRQRAQPKLTITGPHLRIISEDKKQDARVYSIGVKNDGESEEIKGCAPFLNVTNLNGASVILNGKLGIRDLSVTGDSFDLSPKKEEQIRLVTSSVGFFHLNLEQSGQLTNLRNNEQYYLHIIVFNKNGPPAEKRMKLSYHGKGMKLTCLEANT